MASELQGRVRTLFDEALGRAEADRLSFVQSACLDDAETLQVVLRLLEAHRSSKSLLDDGSRTTRRIGRYMVTGEIGRGAMGIVYEAVDPLIGRKVAVKVIHLQACAHAGKAQFLRERLFREARAAGALSHLGVVTVFDVGHEGDLAFIAMERVEGPSLYQVIASGRNITRVEALEVLRQVAAALDYAHRNGIVHRDIKPANILLDKIGAAKLADFGIAKVMSTELHTVTGMLMGTPSYMSPEQIESLPSDGRADQFSLAVVAYELLTGRRPFHADSLATLAHMIVYADRPSARAVNPGLPPAVDMVFHRGLARSPNDRYSSCSELVAALQEASDDIWRPPLQTLAPAPIAAPAPPAVRGHPTVLLRSLVGVGIVLLAFLTAVLLYYVFPPNPPQTVRHDAKKQAAAASERSAVPPTPGAVAPSKGGRSAEATRKEPLVKGEGDGPAKLPPPLPQGNPPQLERALETNAPLVHNDSNVFQADGQTYVWIPPGAFTMGCSEGDMECGGDEKPPHSQQIARGFWLGQTEVTQSAYQRVTHGNPSVHKGDLMPVDNVTWNDAANYCSAIGGRLPREAEWEYAARGHAGITPARYGRLDSIAWHLGNSGDENQPVARKLPNAFGLYDMLGNVWEWMEDSYEGTELKVVRGGARSAGPSYARVSHRNKVEPALRNDDKGFRCAGEWPDPETATPVAPGTAGSNGVYHGGNGVSQPKLLSKVEPEYSEAARQAKLAGVVVLQMVIDAKGNPVNLRVIRSLGLGLDQKAVEAVVQWKFAPAYKDGKPVAVAATVEVNFRLL
jgi:TonB family protein